MLRFVILKDGNEVVDVIECSTTLEAATLSDEKNKERGVAASWCKAESLDTLCAKDPYVQIWLLRKQIEELTPKPQEEKPEAPKYWSNGRPKKK